MIRFLLFGILAMLLVLVVTQIARSVRSANVDWTGVVFAAGFVVMAFYLRHVTGMG